MGKNDRKPFGDRLISSMSKGLEHLRDKEPLRTTFVPLPPAPPEFHRDDLVKLRTRLKLTQGAMAAFVNVSEKTLESWEQGTRSPSGAALRLLQVIDKPEVLREVTSSKREVSSLQLSDGPSGHRRGRALMGLLLELVRSRPGLTLELYTVALRHATQIRQSSGARIGNPEAGIEELLPKLPKCVFPGKSKRPVSIRPLIEWLVQYGYLESKVKRNEQILYLTGRRPDHEHPWLTWPVPEFADVVWNSIESSRKKRKIQEIVEV